MTNAYLFSKMTYPWVRPLTLLLLSGWLLATIAQAQTFTPITGAANPFNVVIAGSNNVGFNTAPSLGDVDGDGDLDVVVGEQYGTLNYYKNTGTATAPVYAQQTGANNPFNGVDVGGYSVPSLGDMDGDGDLDLIVGEFDAALNYFKNTGTATAPVYAQQTGANNPFNGVNVGSSSTSLGDVDGDGDLDALMGEESGTLRYYKNTGTATAPVYAQQTGANNPFNGVDVGNYSAPSLRDVDGDGDLDAVVGETYGAIFYFKNTGTATAPVYAQQTGAANPFNGVNVVLYSSPSLGDVDGDGDLDLVSGAGGGALFYYKNTTGDLVITQQPSPASQAVCVGGSASSTVAASSVGTLTYAWYRNQPDTDEPVSGQTSATLSLTGVQLAQAGKYYCQVTGAGLSVFSTAFTLTVNALPVVSITGLASSFCKNAAAVTLAGSPAGGSFTIDGNAATSLNPASLALGGHTVIYSYTDGNSCSNTASQTVTVNALPVVSITGLDNSFCQNASAVTLAGSPAGGSFTIDGNAATSFNPASLAVGERTVVYTYTDGNSCRNSISQTVTILQPVFSSPATVSGGTVCAGTSVLLGFGVNCPTNASFTAELATAAGLPVGISLGSVSPGSQSVTIPAGTPTGSYKILVTGSNPTITSLSNSMVGVTGLSSNFNSTATVSQVPACAGASIRVSFTQAAAPACSFPLGNVFSAELSDATGSFAVPVTLGTVNSGLNTLTIPQNTPGGSGYRVRIAATTNGSSAYSTPSAAFTVNAPGFASTPTVSSDNKCAGEAVRVSFSVTSCAFPSGNSFTAQLSNASGSFASPVSVGTVSPGGLNNVVIPVGTPAGTGYKLRIVSTNPEAMSAASGNFKVKACGNTREAAPEEVGLQVQVSPNPSPEGRLRIAVSGAEGQALKVELFNGTGQSVREEKIPKAGEAEVLDWDITRQPGGLYLLRVSDGRTAKTLKVLR